MSAQIIDRSTFAQRVGESDERKQDRRFWAALAMWHWRRAWRLAQELQDFEALDRLDRDYEQIMSI